MVGEGLYPISFRFFSLECLRSLVSFYHTHIFVFSVAFVVISIYAVFNNKIHHFKINERWQHDDEFALTIRHEGFARRRDGLKAQSEYSPG